MDAFIALSIPLLLFWLFARAGWHKLREPLWYEALMSSWGLPLLASSALMRALGAFELILALALVLLPVVAGPLAAAVLLAYAAVMAKQLAAGGACRRCGCAGPGSELGISGSLLIRNIVLAGLALVPVAHPPVDLQVNLSVVAAIAAGLFLVIIYEGLEQLLANAQRMRGASA